MNENGELSRRHFLKMAAAGLTAVIASPGQADQQNSDPSSPETYDEGSGPEGLDAKLLDKLEALSGELKRSDADVPKISDQAASLIENYLVAYATAQGFVKEHRTSAMDAEALMAATKEASKRIKLDRRIGRLLITLFENAVHQAASDSIQQMEPPAPDGSEIPMKS